MGSIVGKILGLRRLFRDRYLSTAELRALRESRLREVIRHACENVPYYRTLFKSAGLAPGNVRTLEDLEDVPVTTKEALRAAGEGALAKGVDPSSCIVTVTGGTTGKPFTSYFDAREARTRSLVGFRALHIAGVRPWDRLLTLRRPAQPPSLTNRLGLYRTYYFSPLLPIEEQVRLLRKIHPTVWRVTPSKLRALLHHTDYALSEIIQPRMLITSSEVFDEGLKKRVLADMDVELFNFYISTEFAGIASDCRAHEGLHVNADQLIVECLNDDDRPVDPGTPGSVVVTSLSSMTMPFIRYRLGDICTPMERRCSCGSSFPLISPPLGRQEDVLRLPSGKILSPLGLGVDLRTVDGLDQFRFIQESLDHFVLQLAVWKDPGQEVLSQVRKQVLEYLGEPVRFDVEIVDRLQEDKGKFRRFISKVPQAAEDMDEETIQQ